MIIEVLEDAGIACEPLVAGLPITLDHLRDPAQRVDWDVFAAVMDRLEEVTGGAITPEEIAVRVLRSPSYRFLRSAGQLLFDPRHLYTVAERLVAPAMFANVTVENHWQARGRVVVTGELAAGYRESVMFFRFCHANVPLLPSLLGLPVATVIEHEVSGRHGRMVLQLPRSHTALAKVARGARLLLSLGDAARGVVRQQTELEASVASLRGSRQELRQLLERLPDGVLIHRNGIVVWANAAVIEAFGYERLDQVVGQNALEHLVPEEREVLALRLARPSSEVTHDRVDFRFVRPDGTARRLQAGAVQDVEFDGAPARLVVLRDVTEHRRLEDQLALTERMAALGTLAAGMAHEINNPLAYAHTSLEVASRELAALGDTVRTSRIEASIARAREGTERVRGIVRDLKTLSRAEDEPLDAVDLPALLDSTLALAANAINLKAQVHRRYDAVPLAHATRGRLGQVFLNLLLNAADAIPEGERDRHEIRVSTSTDAAGRAVVEIADTGLGIASKLAGRIFDPFFTTKPVGAGTGLGLAICHRIVAQLGGEIGFDSTPGAGTRFHVALPPSAPTLLVAPPVTRSTAPLARGRVLVVDDEPALLRSVSELLGDVHDVVTASSGRQALDLLLVDHGFDAVLADLMMADLTGMDLYDAVRAKHPGLERRFVFMTGGAFTARGRDFLAQVPNRCIEKPFDADELIATLDEFLSSDAPA